MRCLLLLLLALPRASLTTIAERSNFARTGRYDEVVALCPAFARAFPGKAACVELGRTPEGRPMLALVASSDGVLTAEAARAKGRPVVLVIGGIHAGEIDGKDAGFQVLRELLEPGFFQTAFEKKEGMEAYVAESEARRMLAADPKLRAELEARLRDPAFARDPTKRLDFFRRRHPSWNEAFNLYPVLGLDTRP